MRTQYHKHTKAGGYALMMALAAIVVGAIIFAATLGRTKTVANLNDRNNAYTEGLYAAEAATEKAIARMQFDYLAGDLTYITNDLSTYRASVPTAAEDPYWGQFQFSDGQGHVGQTYVQCISNVGWSSLGSQYAGLNGFITTYRVLSNVRKIGSPYPIVNAAQQDVQLFGIPLFQFAIFYDDLMEFTWCAPFTINGRVHCNTNIFVGSASPLTFNTTVTASGTISSPAWFGKTPGQYTAKVTYHGSPGYSTNVNTMTLPIGTNNSAAAVHEIINQPPVGEDINSPVGLQRYYNKAEIVMLVSNSSVTAILKNAPNDAAPTTLSSVYNPTNFAATNFYAMSTNFPFFSITNGNTGSPKLSAFFDQREQKNVVASQIDLSKLKVWMVTNSAMNAKFPNTLGVYSSGIFPNTFYIADNRTGAATNMYAIRLINAQVAPTNMASSGIPTGFTLATQNPLYVLGNYNCPDSSALNTSTTTKTFPCSLAADALTILSGNWNDSTSYSNPINSDSTSATTVNAAILCGIVYSTGSDVNSFSGGVMNLPRLLEDWSSVTLTMNTSIVNLYNSTTATNQFKAPGIYYYAPSARQFSFDMNFMNQAKLPPCTPMIGSILRTKWALPPSGTTSYAGN